MYHTNTIKPLNTVTTNRVAYLAIDNPGLGFANNGKQFVYKPGEIAGYGRMRFEYQQTLEKLTDIAGVFYSYATPIAVVLNDGTVIMPDAGYSVTTSKHQNYIKRAVTVTLV